MTWRYGSLIAEFYREGFIAEVVAGCCSEALADESGVERLKFGKRLQVYLVLA